MAIRRLRPDEWEALRDLRLRALAADPDAFGATFADAAAHTDEEWQARADPVDGAVFVADDEGALIGMGIGAPAPDHPEAAGVFSMWVAPDARGQGLGAGLLDAVAAWARSLGYTNIGLGVMSTNTSAIALYTRHGFIDIGERYPLGEGSDQVIQIMSRPLEAESTSED